jgi:hypothetical protein
VIGSNDPKQYMLGSVPFSFGDREAVKQAVEKFKDKTVWVLSPPAFDTKTKNVVQLLPAERRSPPPVTVEIVGCPTHQQKRARAPIEVYPTGPQSQRVTGTLGDHALRQDLAPRWLGQNRIEGFRFMCQENGCIGFQDIGQKRQTLNGCGDDTCLQKWKSQSEHFWVSAITVIANVPDSHGLTLVGVTATRDNGEVKLNLWPSAHVIIGGDQAQSLTSLDASGEQLKLLTATFVPTGVPINVEGAAYPTCAAALAAATVCIEDKLFQMNYGIMDAPNARR